MSAGKMTRVKRRLLRQAVADNLQTISGLPPRNLRPARVRLRLWMRRLPMALIVLFSLVGSTYLVSNPAPVRDTITPANIVVQVPPRPKPAGPATIDSLQRIESAAFPLSVRRVIIDAGHGGSDPGATAPMLLTEKDVTLDIAARLESLLEKNGFDAVSTRQADRMVPLRERARIANASSGDIFISIHVNALLKHTSSHGIETYYLGPTSDPALTKLAAHENRASGYSMSDLRRLLDGVYADVRRDESRRLATSVQQRLWEGLRRIDPGMENWGVKRAPFIVLVATEMPAILAEIGCMSNTHDVARLSRPDYRQQIADALFEGIRAYASAHDTLDKKGT